MMSTAERNSGLIAATIGGAGGAALGYAVSVFVKVATTSLSAALWAMLFALPAATLFALPFAFIGALCLRLIEGRFGPLSLFRAEAIGAVMGAAVFPMLGSPAFTSVILGAAMGGCGAWGAYAMMGRT